MKKQPLILVILVLIVCSLQAQTSVISGTVKYNKFTGQVQTPVPFHDSAYVLLKLNGITVAVDTIDNFGNYHFDSLTAGFYEVTAFSDHSWGGAGASDALAILRQFLEIPPMLSGLALEAAHTAAHPYVNAIDALLISARFGGLIPAFPSGDWVFESINAYVDGTNSVIVDIKGMCYGDVNGSFIP